MKVLVFGFKSYGKFTSNISEQVVKRLRGVDTFIFDVRFSRDYFLGKIKKYDIVLGLGQHPRAKKIRIERKACNTCGGKKIGKKKYNYVSLKLKKTRGSIVTYNAGKYVCNYAMYVINETGKRFGFIHIPKDYNVKKAVAFVEKKIKEI